MKVICLEEEAFFELLRIVMERYSNQFPFKPEKWITHKEAMALLNIRSKSTLQKLRDTGCIRFSQPEKKIILYDRDSIYSYLEKNAKNPF